MQTNIAAIESLRTLALAQCVASAHPHDYANNDVFVRFAHLCTAALQGEEWAVERVEDARRTYVAFKARVLNELAVLEMIRSADTNRPDGAIAPSSKDSPHE